MPAAQHPVRRLARRVAVAVGVGLVLPLSWTPETVADHARATALLASISLVALLAVRRMPTAEDRYAEALVHATALEVRLGHVRAATTHHREGRAHAVVTWREAQTVLLDADHRPIATVPRNALAQGWTMSLRFDDPGVPQLLARDRGHLTLVAAVDTENDPWARVGNAPLHVERCDVAFSA
jgi:hypothetical protein